MDPEVPICKLLVSFYVLCEMEASAEQCDAKCKRKAKKIRTFFTDKKVLSFLVWILDVQSVFTKESLISQQSDASVIGEMSGSNI